MKAIFLITIIALSTGINFAQQIAVKINPAGKSVICLGDSLTFKATDIPLDAKIEWLVKTNGQENVYRSDRPDWFTVKSINYSKGQSISVLCVTTVRNEIFLSNEAIIEIPKPITVKIAIPDQPLNQLLVIPDPGLDTLNYQWKWTLGKDSSNYRLAQFLPEDRNLDAVFLTIKDNYGCPTHFRFPIKLVPPPELNITVKSPDIICLKSGLNTEFIIDGISLDEFELAVSTPADKYTPNLVSKFEKTGQGTISVNWINFNNVVQTKISFCFSDAFGRQTIQSKDLLFLPDDVPTEGELLESSSESGLFFFIAKDTTGLEDVVFNWIMTDRNNLDSSIRLVKGKDGAYCYIKDIHSSNKSYRLEWYSVEASCKCRRNLIIKD